MSDMSQNGSGGAPTTQQGVMQQDPAEVTNALLIATLRAAQAAATSSDTREVGEAAKAALAFAQAIVVLDPTLTQSGTPIQHELNMEQLRQDGMKQLELARQSAAAPTPKKSLSVQRDAQGRATSYQMEGQ
jgi:hypothetical protein